MTLPIYKSRIFWTLLAAVVAFVAKYYAPEFPFSETEILALMLFVLNIFKIKPELQARGLMPQG